MPTSTIPSSASHPQPGHTDAPYKLPMSQAALEAIPFPLTIYTRDGLYIGANELIEQLFRVPRAAIVGNFNFLTDPRTQQGDARALFQAAASGQRVQAPPLAYDFSFPGTRTPERMQCWIALTYFPFYDTAGAITHVGAIIQDVTERVLAEQAQQEREAELRRIKALVENASEGLEIAELSGHMVYSNAAFGTLTGYGDQLVGINFAELYPDASTELAAIMPQLFAEGRWSGQLTAQRPDGSSWLAAISAFVLYDDAGQPVGLGSIIRDRTEQQRAEAELQTFKMLIENASDGIGICDMQGTMLYTNPAYQHLLGYDSTLVGMNTFSFIAPEDHDLAAEVMARLPDERVISLNTRYQRQDGSIFPVAGNAFIQELAAGELQIIGFVRDISAQQRAEAEREQLQQEVIIAQQAALRELSTPLIPITDEVVAMPLIGSIDSGRAQLVLETLLIGVAERRAGTTIIDITGVPVVDTQVANALIRAAQAVKLLGARVILTGIRPEVAQTLVNLGVDLSGIVTRGTLQSGIAEALGRTGAPVASGRR